jgi:nucleoid-associated protein YgaU
MTPPRPTRRPGPSRPARTGRPSARRSRNSGSVGRSAGRVAAAARGLGAAVVLAGLLVGVPLALLVLGADPLQARLPSLDRVGQLLTSPDHGQLWTAAARITAWAGWAGFALATLAEAAAAAAGRALPALRGLSPMQRPAAYLIAVITAALAAPTAAAATPAHAAVAAPTTAHPHPGPPLTLTGGSGPTTRHPTHPATRPAAAAGRDVAAAAGPASYPTPPAASAGRPAVHVQRHDSLWSIAVRHLGDGRRWQEIYRLNHDRPQPDGRRLTNPDRLHPGWLLLLPPDATGATTLPATAAAGTSAAGPQVPHEPGTAPVVVVKPGDTLSAIAQRHLGTAAATAALYAANAGRLQPDGRQLIDPDHIRPGWILTLPTTWPTTPTRPADTSPHRPAPPDRPAPSDRPAPPDRPALPTRTPPAAPQRPPTPAGTTPPATSAPSPDSAAPTASPGPSEAPSPAHAQRRPERWVQLPSGSILALGLLATLVALAALTRRRRRQHRRPADPYTPDHQTPGRPPARERQPADDSGLPAVTRHAEAAWLANRRLDQQRMDHSDDDGSDDDGSDDDGSDDDGSDDDAGENRAAAAGELADDWTDDPNAPDHPDSPDKPSDRPRRPAEPLPSAAGQFRPAPATAPPVAPPEDRGGGQLDRGLSAGGVPAPTVGELTGAPAAVVLAQAAWSGGVGLVGPGAAGAARAVMIRLLTAAGPMGAQLITTSQALAELLPAEAVNGAGAVPGLRVYPSLAAALSACEADLLSRTRQLADADTDDLAVYRAQPDAEPIPATLLLAPTPDTAAQGRRAHAILSLAAGRDLGGVWLGPSSTTLHVGAQGHLHHADTHDRTPTTATDPAPTGATGTGPEVGRAEILTPDDTAELLTGLLASLRDSLDLLDRTTLLPTPSHPEPAPERAPTAAEVPGGISPPAGGESGSSLEESAAGPQRFTATTPSEPPRGPAVLREGTVLDVAVLGRVQVRTPDGAEVTGLRAKIRDLTALLAVHPDGLTAGQVGEHLWPGDPPGRVAGRLSATLALARRALRDAASLTHDPTTPDQPRTPAAAATTGAPVDLIPLTDGRYQLHPDLIDTDYRRLLAALATGRQARDAGDVHAEVTALGGLTSEHRGEALDGVAYTWAEHVRESTRRRLTDALARLADLLDPTIAAVAQIDAATAPTRTLTGAAMPPSAAQPAAALAALEQAAEVDPYNEQLYRRMMHLHARAGRTDGVRRTLRLLEARLADIDTDPDPDTTALAAQLIRQRTQPLPAAAGRSVATGSR